MDFPLVNKKTKIVVAMSGGVDSSTVAALLKHNGYRNLIGITLKLYDNDESRGISCKDISFKSDAQSVANNLGIEHKILDLRYKFASLVINPFIDSYLNGLTPAPCVTCNREIKFGALIEEAKKLNAQILVTGHYIKWVYKDYPMIYMNQESIRDQSYFLAKIKKENLNMIRFPLANMSKQEVRNVAEKYSLHVAHKPSSNDICFAGGKSYSNLITKTSGNTKEGNILDVKGNIIGKHQGIYHYTIGQRKGIGVSSQKPLYVIKINAEDNTIVVATSEALAKKSIIIKDINWLGEDPFENNIRILDVKVRASQQLVEATVEPLDKYKAKVTFSHEIYGVAKGQICAFYKKGQLLGGGDI